MAQKEMVREGIYKHGQVKRGLAWLRRKGYIELDRFLSHLESDGPGAQRYSVTELGRSFWRRHRPEFPYPPRIGGGGTETAAEKATVPSGGPSAQSVVRSRPTFVRAYEGVHYNAYRLEVRRSFARDFGWAEQHPMVGGWWSRSSPFGRGISLQESGSRGKASGAVGNSILVRFRVTKAEAHHDPLEAEAIALDRVAQVRRTLEREYGCELSEPVPVTPPKHTLSNDPLARALSQLGISVEGIVGADDTPERGSMHFRSAELLLAYVEGVAAIPKLVQQTADGFGAQSEAHDQVLDALRQGGLRIEALAAEVRRQGESAIVLAGHVLTLQTMIGRLLGAIQAFKPDASATPGMGKPSGVGYG